MRVRIHAIEKCVNLFFERSITRSRSEVLRDPLRDRNPLAHPLMTSLQKVQIYE